MQADRIDVVVLAASAGGLPVLRAILRALPTPMPAAVLIVQHVGSGSQLVELLRLDIAAPVDWLVDGEPVRRGAVGIVPALTEAVVGADHRVSMRPIPDPHLRTVDRLLASVATAYGPRGLCAILSGTGEDGAAGVRAMHQAGATVLAQDPSTAEYGGMPTAAIATGCVARALPLDALGSEIAAHVARTVRPG